MIEVQHLNLAFGEGRSVTRCCMTSVSHVKPGEIYGLVGESGSGKTTVPRAWRGCLPTGRGN